MWNTEQAVLPDIYLVTYQELYIMKYIVKQEVSNE